MCSLADAIVSQNLSVLTRGNTLRPKVLLTNGEIRNFRLSNQRSASNGMRLQAMADQFGVPVADYADVAFRAGLTPTFSYGCAVLLDADRVNFCRRGARRV